MLVGYYSCPFEEHYGVLCAGAKPAPTAQCLIAQHAAKHLSPHLQVTFQAAPPHEAGTVAAAVDQHPPSAAHPSFVIIGDTPVHDLRRGSSCGERNEECCRRNCKMCDTTIFEVPCLPTHTTPHALLLPGGSLLYFCMAIVDLDPKPAQKLKAYYKLDRDIALHNSRKTEGQAVHQ